MNTAARTTSPQRDPRAGAVVQWVSLAVAAGLAGLAFATSFEALSDLARTHRAFPPGFEDVLPYLLDGVAIVAGGVMYVRHVHGEKPGYALLLLLLAMFASVAANMVHAPVALDAEAAGALAGAVREGAAQGNRWLAKIIAATPPIAFAAVAHLIHDEMGRRVHRREAREQAVTRNQAAIAEAREQARQARQDAAEQVEALKVEARRQLDTMQATMEQLQAEAREAVQAARTDAARQIEQHREQVAEHRRELEPPRVPAPASPPAAGAELLDQARAWVASQGPGASVTGAALAAHLGVSEGYGRRIKRTLQTEAEALAASTNGATPSQPPTSQ